MQFSLVPDGHLEFIDNVQVIDFLLDRGADISKRDGRGRTM